MAEYKTLGSNTRDNLIAGDFPLVSDAVTIAAGQNLVRGSVLGRIQDNSHYVLSDSSAMDGSEVPVAILAEAVDSANGETESVCYLSGQFNTMALIFGPGQSPATIKHNLRLLNIYLTDTH